MTTRGFILGKFMPPHQGHIWACNTAAQLVDELTVLVCTLDREPIDGEMRFAWMKDLLPNARVIHLAEDVPQDPDDHPDFWDIWRDICQRAHPAQIDMVFGSDDYIPRLASELDAKPVLLDPERLTVPVSATQIRNNPSQHWQFIPSVVRPYFQKRIVLFGPESVGKSTLAQKLAGHYQTLFVPEYGRTYTEQFSPQIWDRSDFVSIAETHGAMRKAMEPLAGPVIFEDTDPLLTCAWEDMLTGHKSDWVDDVELADLYLFLGSDIPWEDDGTRYFRRANEQEQFHEKCHSILDKVGARYAHITGEGERRLTSCIDAIEAEFSDFLAG